MDMGAPEARTDVLVTENLGHQYRACGIVEQYVLEHLEKTDEPPKKVETYIVWFCFILGGWKALVSTDLPDGMYYEVTYNKGANEIYLDAYKKFDNRRIPLPNPA